MQEINPLYIQALSVLLDEENPTISTIQRKCSIGYSHARKIVQWMEDKGYVQSSNGARDIQLFITKEQFQELYGN
ncbi:MAG: hypothetical protein IKA57_05430 [Clostridia bacterium]|nr:hypothetical protein [Clostridia bacterium]